MFEVEKWLHSRIGLNFRSGLGRMQRAVDLLGNPEQTYPIIHVTGTNGKKRLTTNKKAKLPPKTDSVFFMLQDCTIRVKLGLTLAIPVTVAKQDPAKKGKM